GVPFILFSPVHYLFVIAVNAFDFVITIAIGSTLGRLITAKGVSLLESITAFLTLLLLQRLVSWLTVRSARFKDLVTANPSLLYFRGHFLHRVMQKHRITEQQLLAVVRKNKIGSLDAVEAIVLESAGTIAVVKKATDGERADISVLGSIPKVNQRGLL
ncbi:MAG: DUF421 domain-containing protein, partial [Thainema sp.]